MPASHTFRFFGIDWTVNGEHSTDTWVFVTYWLFASPIILTSFGPKVPPTAVLGFYAYMVVAYTASAWLIVNLLFPSYIPKRRFSLAFVSLLSIMFITAIGNQLVAVQLMGDSGKFWLSTVKFNLPNDAQNILTVVAILAGKKYFDERQRNTLLESERRQSELQRLRAQVDPHFLFNSLNILDILIESNPDEARHFVHRLSNLYRYLIRHRDEDLVPAAEEVDHARDYRYLIERRFGNTFRFRENFASEELQGFYLPPGALQTVLENIFKHSVATATAPVEVDLGLDGKTLVVANDFRPKPARAARVTPSTNDPDGSGSGLENLRRRLALMSDGELTAGLDDKRWVVRIPLVSTAPVLAKAVTPQTTFA